MEIKIKNIIKELKQLTLIETTELIKNIEEIFSIEANVPIFSPTPVISQEKESLLIPIIEEKSIFNVILTGIPADKKIAILKIVRNITGLGLKESKDIVDNPPKTLKEGLSKNDAETIKKELEALGATVSLQ